MKLQPATAIETIDSATTARARGFLLRAGRFLFFSSDLASAVGRASHPPTGAGR
jgi:hypothetical protein